MKCRGTTLETDRAQADFAERAAEAFAKDAKLTSFADNLAPGQLLALRWGLHDRAVLVIKLDDDHMPTNYHDAVYYKENPR